MKIKGWDKEDLQDAFKKDEEPKLILNVLNAYQWQCMVAAKAGDSYQVQTDKGIIRFTIPIAGNYMVTGFEDKYIIQRI